MDAFRRLRLLEFEKQATARIQQEYPEDYAKLGAEGSLELVRHTIRSGAQYGIHNQQGLRGLMQLYIEFGTGLELAPYRQWALQLLDHPKLPGPIKVNLIRGRLSALTQGRRIIQHKADGEE
jgi:hypothetical protein